VTADPLDSLGIVIIGRNEGSRLRTCIESSLQSRPAHIVYVDSGSRDDSVALARSLGVHVVELTSDLPFTASRGRNAGLRELLRIQADLQFVQFIDGDCELNAQWPRTAADFLRNHSGVVAVTGRRRERYPERSVYNLICDIEWDTPLGETKAFGGDVLCRTQPVLEVGGYNEQVIAGEDTELGVRLRRKGWKIWRLEADMTIHDAELLRLSQWWQRSRRTGFAFANGAWLHGRSAERHFVRELRSTAIWGIAFPLVWIVAAFRTPLALPIGALILVMQILRVWWRLGRQRPGAFPYAVGTVVGKWAEAQGAMEFAIRRFFQRRQTLIEYK
jgi:glycosyltransferase involved in cell wall biosynthesis